MRLLSIVGRCGRWLCRLRRLRDYQTLHTIKIHGAPDAALLPVWRLAWVWRRGRVLVFWPISSQLMASNSSHTVQAVLEQQRQALLALCERLSTSPIVYCSFLPLWVAAFAYWGFSVYHRHRRHALDLHRLLLWVPAISALYCGLSAVYYWTCPWDNTLAQLVGACQVVVSILKEPVMLVCLLMVAKGWGITRDKLTLKETVISSVIVGFLYMSVVVQFVLVHVLAVVPLLVMWLLMLINVIGSILTNLRYLKAQLLALRAFNIDATTTPAYTKYRMFRSLLASCVIYYVLDLSLFIVQYVDLHTPDKILFPNWAVGLSRQILELGTALLIGYAFRARSLNALFHQVQQVAVDLAGDLLPQITTAWVDVDALRGGETVPWSRTIDLKLDRGPDGQPTPRSAAHASSTTTAASSSAQSRPPAGEASASSSSNTAGVAPPQMLANNPPQMLLVLNPEDWLIEHAESAAGALGPQGGGSSDGGVNGSVSRALVVAHRVEPSAPDHEQGGSKKRRGRGSSSADRAPNCDGTRPASSPMPLAGASSAEDSMRPAFRV
jgi:hypothetical protein